MFRLSRNERSHWSGNGVHVEPESVFMIGRNMHQGLSTNWAAFGAIGIGFVLRLLAVRFKWGLPTFNYQYATH